MAERAELAAGTKERGDCHIDFLAVECITRSPPLPLFSPLRSVTADHPWFEYYPFSFLLKRVVFFCIFNTERVSLSSFCFFFFSFRSFPGRAAIFCIRERTALVFGAGFTRNGVRMSREGCEFEISIPILRRNLWFANFQDSNYVKLFFLFVRLSEQLGRRRRKKELEFKLLKFFNNERLFCGKLIGRGRDIEASGKSNLLDGRKQRFKDGWDGREGAACAHTHSLQRNRCKLWRRYVVVVDDCAAALNNRRCSKVTRDTAPRTLS